MNFDLRLANRGDVVELKMLIEKSARTLLAPFYTERQIVLALDSSLGVDSQLILDRTFFVAVHLGVLVGCGGWSRRKTLFGSDHGANRESALLDPASDAARIRAFFVEPSQARRGIGTAILKACEEAASAEDFRRFELVATLGGVPLYERFGYVAVERFDVDLRDGHRFPVVRMRKSAFRNTYEDTQRAEAYARLEFAYTYYLAYLDLPAILGDHVKGTRALDFGCGTGRSTRFLRDLGFEVVGVDIAEEMIGKAREIDPAGDYRLLADDDFSVFSPGSFDLALSMFTFDNIPGTDLKERIFTDLRKLLEPAGTLVSVVSSPEIYVHEWASFSTKDYPENRVARSGDVVRIVTTDFPDRRPTEDILFDEEAYREVYRASGLDVVATYRPLARGDEPFPWISETKIAPWTIYVLRPS